MLTGKSKQFAFYAVQSIESRNVQQPRVEENSEISDKPR